MGGTDPKDDTDDHTPVYRGTPHPAAGHPVAPREFVSEPTVMAGPTPPPDVSDEADQPPGPRHGFPGHHGGSMLGPMTLNNSTATWPTYDRDAFLDNLKAMAEKAERLRAEADSKVCVFDGTIDQFRAELSCRGMVRSPGPDHPLGLSALDGLEVREFNGKVYAGTLAALQRALPFLFPLDMPTLGSRDFRDPTGP